MGSITNRECFLDFVKGDPKLAGNALGMTLQSDEKDCAFKELDPIVAGSSEIYVTCTDHILRWYSNKAAHQR